MHHQAPFDSGGATTYVDGGEVPTNTAVNGEIIVPITATPGSQDIYFIEVKFVNTAPPARAGTVRSLAWVHPEFWGNPGYDTSKTQYDELCVLHPWPGEGECEPKDGVGVVDIPYIPPPIGFQGN